MLIALALSIRQMKVPSYLRRLTIPLIILCTLALVATFSRGGWFEAVLTVMILAGARWLRDGFSRKALVTAVTVLTLILLCLYIPNPISSRLFADDNGSAHSRIPLMHLAGRVIAANPILGVGANNFAEVMGTYTGSEFRHEWIYTVHNGFLLVCAETGVLGLAAYLWIYFSIIRRGWRIWKTRDEVFAPLALGIVAGIGGLLSHMLVESFPDGGLLQLIWLFIALLGVCEMIQRRESGDPVSLQTTAARAR
jgi:O-antigen ligase